MSTVIPNDKLNSKSKWHSRMQKAKSKSVNALQKAKQASLRSINNDISRSSRHGSPTKSMKKDAVNITTKTTGTTNTTNATTNTMESTTNTAKTNINTTETTKESNLEVNDSNSIRKKEPKNRWSSAVNDVINNPRSSYGKTNKINAMSSTSNGSFRPQRSWHGFSSKQKNPNLSLGLTTTHVSSHGYSSNLYKPTSIMSCHSSDSDDSFDSYDGESSVISAISITDTLPSPPKKDELIMTREVKQQKTINALKKKCSYYESINSDLSKQTITLNEQLKVEQDSRKEEITVLKTSLDETELKLSVLEQHFRSLNDPKPEKEDNEANNFEEESLRSSIVSLDSAYFNEITSSLTEKTINLAKIEKEHNELKEKSEAVESELRMDVDDLNKKVEARETTIRSLEDSLRQMRESLFAPKVLLGRRSHLMNQVDDDEISVGTAMTEVTFSIPDTQSPKKGYDHDLSKDKQIDHEKKIEELKEEMNSQLESKDNLIAKLTGKLEKNTSLLLKSRKELKDIKSKKKEYSDLIFSLRSLTIMNEMLGVSVHKLDEFKNAFEARLNSEIAETDDNKPDSNSNEHGGKETIQQILSVATRIELFQEEMRAALKTTELSMKNRLQEIKNQVRMNQNTDVKNNQIESSQNFCEEKNDLEKAKLDESIKNTHDSCLSTLRNLESQLSKRLDEIKESIQSYDYIVSEKQDMIESLELTCRDNNETIEKLQHELNKGTKTHRREKSFPGWKSKPSTHLVVEEEEFVR